MEIQNSNLSGLLPLHGTSRQKRGSHSMLRDRQAIYPIIKVLGFSFPEFQPDAMHLCKFSHFTELFEEN